MLLLRGDCDDVDCGFEDIWRTRHVDGSVDVDTTPQCDANVDFKKVVLAPVDEETTALILRLITN